MIQISMAVLENGSDRCKVYRDYMDTFSIKLDPSKTYDVGIDQSTSCTGIGICPLDDSFKIILEILNVNAGQYYKVQLRNFIKEIFSGIKIRCFIMEEPLGYLSGRRNKVLTDLKKYLDELRGDLSIEMFDSSNPPSWRHGLMPKATQGDRRKKSTVVDTLLEMFPGFSNFLPYCNGDTDGFEALGIIIGYKARHGIDSSGGLKIVGPKNTRKEALSFFKYYDVSSGDFDSIMKEVMRIPKEVITGIGELKVKSYNDEGNIYCNAKMSLVDTFTFTIVSEDLDILSVLIRMNMTPKKNHMLFMFTVHKKYYTDYMIRELFNDGYFPVLFK